MVEVRACRLDDVVDDRVDFIKLDLEGWELPALEGSVGLVSKYHPKLAIAIYHSADDLRKITNWVLRNYSNKKIEVYLRHYTQGWSETILYCIPS